MTLAGPSKRLVARLTLDHKGNHPVFSIASRIADIHSSKISFHHKRITTHSLSHPESSINSAITLAEGSPSRLAISPNCINCFNHQVCLIPSTNILTQSSQRWQFARSNSVPSRNHHVSKITSTKCFSHAGLIKFVESSRPVPLRSHHVALIASSIDVSWKSFNSLSVRSRRTNSFNHQLFTIISANFAHCSSERTQLDIFSSAPVCSPHWETIRSVSRLTYHILGALPLRFSMSHSFAHSRKFSSIVSGPFSSRCLGG